MTLPIDSQTALLYRALTHLSHGAEQTVHAVRPVPALPQRAWTITVRRKGILPERSYLALFLPRLAPDTDPAASYLRAAQAGLPAPVILTRAEDADHVLLLCEPPSGDSLEATLQDARAPWQISSAAVSLARFLTQLHRSASALCGGDPAATATLDDSAQQLLLRLRDLTATWPQPLRSSLYDMLAWIEANLEVDPDLVPTLGSPRLGALFATSGDIDCVLGWEQLALRPAAHDIAGLLLEVQRFPAAVREQFVSVTVAAYAQGNAAALHDAPARALLTYVEHVAIVWSARGSRSGPPAEASAELATLLDETFRASQQGLTALARHGFTL